MRGGSEGAKDRERNIKIARMPIDRNAYNAKSERLLMAGNFPETGIGFGGLLLDLMENDLGYLHAGMELNTKRGKVDDFQNLVVVAAGLDEGSGNMDA